MLELNRLITNISIIGCGWLGMPLGESLLNQGYRVKGSTTHMAKLSRMRKIGLDPFIINLEPNYKGEGHFLDSDLLIVNLPPRNTASDSDFHKKQLLSLSKRVKKSSVVRVLFVSSTAVYPDTDSLVYENDAQYQALSRSGISLLEMEDVFRKDDTLETTIVRFGGLYGPERHPGNFLAGKHDLPGGENPVNMIHLEDCIGVISHIIKHKIWGETFNACSPNHPSRASFYQQAAAECGLEPPTFSSEAKPFKIVSSEKLMSQTGYQFIH